MEGGTTTTTTTNNDNHNATNNDNNTNNNNTNNNKRVEGRCVRGRKSAGNEGPSASLSAQHLFRVLHISVTNITHVFYIFWCFSF